MRKEGRIFRPLTIAAVFGLLISCKSSPTTPGTNNGVTVSSVSVSAAPNPVKMPTAVQATATVLPAGSSQSVTWTSSDPSRAMVNASGLITPLLSGSVTITATSTVDPTKSGSIQLGIQCPDPRLVTVRMQDSGDTTWENWIPDPACFDYIVQVDNYFSNAVLTIQPGTVVGFEAGLGMRIVGDAGLIADGTAADPIVLTGVTKQRGFWKGISLENSPRTDQVVAHTTIEYTSGQAISQTEKAGLIISDGVTVRLEHSTFRQNAGFGLFLDRESDILGAGGLVMTENAMGPAYAHGSEVEHLTHGGGSLTGNDLDEVVVYPNNIENAALWSTGIYRVLRVSPQGFNVMGSLTLGPGVQIRFEADQAMIVLAGGGLAALGTAADPVVITGTAPVPGHWRGLAFIDTNNPMNKLDHAVIAYGGGRSIGSVSDLANVVLTHGTATPSRVTVSNTTIMGGAGYGLYARFSSRLDGFTGNTLTGNALGPASLDAPVVGDLLAGNTMTGNLVDEITVNGVTIDKAATWRDFGAPYHFKRFNALVAVVDGVALTVEPGVEVLFGPGMGLSMQHGASIKAEGTAQDPISFKGRTGAWRGIDISDASGSFDYISITGAGSDMWGLVQQAGAVTIRTANALAPTSTATFTGNVTLNGGAYGLVFGYGDTYAFGCPGPVYIPPPDVVSDHCK